MFPGFLMQVLTQLSFPKPLTTFLTCIREEGETLCKKKFCHNQVSNVQRPGHKSDACLLNYSFRQLDKKSVNSLPNKKFSEWSKLKTLADKTNLTISRNSFLEWVAKHCGKTTKCCLPAFSPFPTMFSKGFFFTVV